ncbi:hypothetical protein VTJ83DRAFT_6010 [Remersonia thermophila]|uniref:NAD-dependent epimerase/dehydratase domain-containing protein n=1 Tax=Remersonia thermophila TaxID=72144 RepID=A0ABR4D8I5_9PEZI
MNYTSPPARCWHEQTNERTSFLAGKPQRSHRHNTMSDPQKPTILVTGSSGHLGKALMLALPSYGYDPVGIDVLPSSTTTAVGSVADPGFVRDVFARYRPEHVVHAATLHKPHVGTHGWAEFCEVNVKGTAVLLEAVRETRTGLSLSLSLSSSSLSSSSSSSSLSSAAAAAASASASASSAASSSSAAAAAAAEAARAVPDGRGSIVPVRAFIFVSTTSAFGHALAPPPKRPAALISESVAPRPKNIYGVTKTAAEDLCKLAHDQTGLPVVALRVARFFPEEDDAKNDLRGDKAGDGRATMEGDNLKVLELAYRRVDIADVVGACVAAVERAGEVGWGRYVVSAPSPFLRASRAGGDHDDGGGGGGGRKDTGDKEADGEMRAQQNEEEEEEEEEEENRLLAALGGGDVERAYDWAVPGIRDVFARKGWRFLRRVDRVYDSRRAERELGWRAEYTIARAVDKIARGEEWRSDLALRVGTLGYHAVPTGVYTTKARGADETGPRA